MSGLRRFIRARRSGTALALCLAYSLAIQAVLASIGLGMSLASGSTDFVICSTVVHPGSREPLTKDQRRNPNSGCPFCFIASQTACHIAMTNDVPAFPAYVGSLVAEISDLTGDDTFVPGYRRKVGEARAPPIFSA
jgi:hypothetical protein